jgi:hypothetical protein
VLSLQVLAVQSSPQNLHPCSAMLPNQPLAYLLLQLPFCQLLMLDILPLQWSWWCF